MDTASDSPEHPGAALPSHPGHETSDPPTSGSASDPSSDRPAPLALPWEVTDRDGPGAPAVASAAGVVGLLLGVAFAMGRRLWFFSDDWNILADYHQGNLLEPFNGHLSALPAGAYQALFHTVGVSSYLPYRLCGLAALGVLGFQVARYALARVPAPVAVLALAAVMWNSFGATNVLFPFLMNFSLPIAAMVAIWWHLDRHSRGHDLAAGAWLAVALATSGLGVMTLAAVIVELAWERAPLRRWAAFAPATGLWLAWWVGHRSANEISTEVTAVVAYFLRMLWGGASALAAGNRAGGLVLAVLLGVLLVTAIRRGSFGARSAGALAAAAAFAGLTAVTRLDVVPSIAPDELRYGWTIGAYLVLAAVSMWPGAPRGRIAAGAIGDGTEAGAPPDADLSPHPSPETGAPVAHGGQPAGEARSVPAWLSPCALGLAGIVLALGAWRLIDGMGEWTDQVAGAAPGLRSVLYATEAAGAERVDPHTVLPLSYVPVTTGGYLDAVADVGSPLQGATATQIGGRPDQREVADRVFFDSVELALTASPSPAPGVARCSATVEAPPAARILVANPSTTSTEHRTGGTGGGASADEGADEGGETGAGGPAGDGPAVTVSRFSDHPARTLATDSTLETQLLELPADAPVGTDAAVPFRLRAQGGAVLCLL